MDITQLLTILSVKSKTNLTTATLMSEDILEFSNQAYDQVNIFMNKNHHVTKPTLTTFWPTEKGFNKKLILLI